MRIRAINCMTHKCIPNQNETNWKQNTKSIQLTACVLYQLLYSNFSQFFFSFNNIHSFPLDLIFYVFIFFIALVFVFYNYTLFSTRRFGMSEKTTSQNAIKGNRRWLRWMGKRLSLSSSFWNRISRSCFIASNDLCADQMVPNRIYEDRTQPWHWKL